MAIKIENNIAKIMKREQLKARDIVRAGQDIGAKITYPKLNYWIKNKWQPRLPEAFYLCQILNCNLSQLFKRKK